MVPWGWLIAAFYGGVLFAVFVLSLCTVAGRVDDRMEQIARQMKDIPPEAAEAVTKRWLDLVEGEEKK